MPDPNKPNGGDPAGPGGGAPPAAGGDTSGAGQKTVEQRLAELETENKRLASSNQTYQEEIKRMSGTMQVLISKVGNTGRGTDVTRTVPLPGEGVPQPRFKRDFSGIDPVTKPEEFAAAVIDEAVDQVSNLYAETKSREEQLSAMRESFYKGNPDLRGWEPFVVEESKKVAAEKPWLDLNAAFAETAIRVRDLLKARGVTGSAPNPQDPPAPLPPGGGDGKEHVTIKPPKDKAEEPFNAEKAAAEALEDEVKTRSAEASKRIGVGGK